MAADSRPDTWEHIHKVRNNLVQIVNDLLDRSQRHDCSKLEDPEKATFDEFSPKLDGTTYDSAEYKAQLAEMMHGALKHHYAQNDHHPEHFVGSDGETTRFTKELSAQAQGDILLPMGAGIHGMNLIQLLEMLADWKAATMRHADGDLRKSIRVNADRFGYGEEIENLLLYTASYLGWLT
jgi:Family of unknown function (DUF5662)